MSGRSRRTLAARRRVRLGRGFPFALLVLGVGSLGCDDSEEAADPVPAETAASPPSDTADPAATSTSSPPSSGQTPPPQPTIEEVRFTSGRFEVVGDLTVPATRGPHPAVIIVHGDGPQTRSSTPGTRTVLERFGDHGFAVLVWDKPGSGESSGEFDQEQTLRQRAAILADGVGVLRDHPDIDPDRIGFWGLSQAGWVMPLALGLTDDVAFMVVTSGGGEDSIDQLSYQLGQRVVCEGRTTEEGDLVEANFPLVAKGPTYEDYAAAMDVLTQIDGWENFAGPDVRSEDEWQPWPTDIDAYFDPITVIEHTTIPVLAVFGERDRYVDPVQGAAAYEEALRAAGNPSFHVELIPGMSHTMQNQDRMCGSGSGTSSRYVELLDEWLASLRTTWTDTG